jgi:MFS family permease
MNPTDEKVGVLKERNMRWYLGGQLLSLTGTMLQTAVLSLLILAIVGKNGAAFWVGVVWGLDLVPGFLLGPFAGILLDRFNKRKVLLITSTLGILQTGTLAFLTYTNQITILEICILALFMGIVNAIDGPGRNVIIKDAVVHDYNVRSASKMFTSLYNLAQIAGPGLAGFLVLSFGYPLTFVINGFSFAALIVALLNMKLAVKNDIDPNDLAGKKPIMDILKEGVRYILNEKGIRDSIFLTGGLCIFGFFYYPILSVIARDMFGGGPITYSYLAGSSGVGSFIGALILINFGERISHKLLVVTGIICMGIGLLVLSMLSYLPLGMLFIAIIGFSFMVSFSSLRSSIIHITKQSYVGIVMGYTFTFFYGGMMLGSFLGGYFANLYGCNIVLMSGGIILTAIGCLTPLLPGMSRLD